MSNKSKWNINQLAKQEVNRKALTVNKQGQTWNVARMKVGDNFQKTSKFVIKALNFDGDFWCCSSLTLFHLSFLNYCYILDEQENHLLDWNHKVITSSGKDSFTFTSILHYSNKRSLKPIGLQMNYQSASIMTVNNQIAMNTWEIIRIWIENNHIVMIEKH